MILKCFANNNILVRNQNIRQMQICYPNSKLLATEIIWPGNVNCILTKIVYAYIKMLAGYKNVYRNLKCQLGIDLLTGYVNWIPKCSKEKEKFPLVTSNVLSFTVSIDYSKGTYLALINFIYLSIYLSFDTNAFKFMKSYLYD